MALYCLFCSVARASVVPLGLGSIGAGKVLSQTISPVTFEFRGGCSGAGHVYDGHGKRDHDIQKLLTIFGPPGLTGFCMALLAFQFGRPARISGRFAFCAALEVDRLCV